MQQVPDYYESLNVAKDASPEEIRRAYHDLAKEWHPDANKHSREKATTKFAEISAAYEILSDSEKRRKYDFYRDYSFGYAPFTQAGAGSRREYDAEWEELSKWFQQIYEKHLHQTQKQVNRVLRRIKRGFIGAAIGLGVGFVFRAAALPLVVVGWLFGYYLVRDRD
jgi:DnaJ-class molecular chaperone